jgi:hypothetical protein
LKKGWTNKGDLEAVVFREAVGEPGRDFGDSVESMNGDGNSQHEEKLPRNFFTPRN